MLGGTQITERTREHAREMLEPGDGSQAKTASFKRNAAATRPPCGVYARFVRYGQTSRTQWPCRVSEWSVMVKPRRFGDRSLPVLDAVVREFLDPPAVDADDVVVVHAFVQFEDRRAALEMMPRHEPRRFELRQNPVNRRESDVLVEFEQPAINILGAHVPDRRHWRGFPES